MVAQRVQETTVTDLTETIEITQEKSWEDHKQAVLRVFPMPKTNRGAVGTSRNKKHCASKLHPR